MVFTIIFVEKCGHGLFRIIDAIPCQQGNVEDGETTVIFERGIEELPQLHDELLGSI